MKNPEALKAPRRWTNLILGLILDAAGVSLITKADFGISAVSSFPYSLHQAFPAFSFGVWSYLFQLGLTGILMLEARQFSIRYLSAFVVSVAFGYLLDAANLLSKLLPRILIARCAYFALGTVCLIVGVCLMMCSELPILPQDLFVRELSKLRGWKLQRVKTVFDCACLLGSVVVSLLFSVQLDALGIGTIISALVMGKGIELTRKILHMGNNLRE